MKRSGPLRRKKSMRRVSAKRAATNVKRSAFVREQLSARPFCEVRRAGCYHHASELHEPLTRARAPGEETILDPANSVAVCRVCHTWIHSHPAEATALGLLRSAKGGAE